MLTLTLQVAEGIVRPTCISVAVATACTLTMCATALSTAWTAQMRATAASGATVPIYWPSAASADASAPPLARSVHYMATDQPWWYTLNSHLSSISFPPLVRGVSVLPATSSTQTQAPAPTRMSVWALYTGANTSASTHQAPTPAGAMPASTWSRTAWAARAKVSYSDCCSGVREPKSSNPSYS